MPETPEQRRRRIHVWKHNSFFGHVRMMQSNLESIINSRSTCTDTKQIAKEMIDSTQMLLGTLRTRIDPDNL